jgi:hypothetical protein
MRSRYVSALLAAAGLAVMTATAAVAAPAAHARMDAAAASATRSHPAASERPAVAQATHPGSCTGTAFGSNRDCIIPTQDVWSAEVFNPVIFPRSGGYPILINGDVSITCYYYGSSPSGYPSDGVLDHTVEPVVGHIPDPYVNEGDENPWDSPYDLPLC